MNRNLENKLSISMPDIEPPMDPSSFIQSAGEVPSNTKSPPTTLPWEDPSVRIDHKVNFLLRLPEDYHKKLVWLSEQSKLDDNGREIRAKGDSKHSILLKGIKGYLDREVAKKLKKSGH